MNCQCSLREGETMPGGGGLYLMCTLPWLSCSEFYFELRKRVEKYFKDNNIVSLLRIFHSVEV